MKYLFLIALILMGISFLMGIIYLVADLCGLTK